MSRRKWLAVVALAAIGAGLWFGSDYIEDKREKEQLREMIASAERMVSRTPSGKLGKNTARTLGSFLVAMITHEIFKRANQPDKRKRVPVHCYIDEFQTFIGEDPIYLETILSEARKYGLNLTVANQ